MSAKDVDLSPVRPLVRPDQAAAEWAFFEELKAKLLVDDDYQAIAGKRYIKRSGFRKIAVYFGLSDRIIKEERVDREDKSFTWRVVVLVTAPNGRICAGVGVCDSRERRFAHVEHDVYATAHTRAKSRAVSDMVAGGAVSAEEVESTPPQLGSAPEGTPVPPDAPHEGVDAVGDVAESHLGAGDRTPVQQVRDCLPEDLRLGLTIVDQGGGLVTIATSWLPKLDWDRLNEKVLQMGGGWVSDGKSSRWEVRV